MSASASNQSQTKPTLAATATAESFDNEGQVFKAKLIGSELVLEPRGDKMCQNSIQRLKAIIKGTNSHKRRIVLKISFDGVKVYDEKTNEILHHHEISQISYIASDDSDTRTFGYVSDVPNKAHQFICFKTGGPAINVMSKLSALFEAVLEKKNKAEKEKQQQEELTTQAGDSNKNGNNNSININNNNDNTTSNNNQQSNSKNADDDIIITSSSDDIIISSSHSHEPFIDSKIISDSSNKLASKKELSQDYSIDLIYDSGILDGDLNIFGDQPAPPPPLPAAQLPPPPQQQATTTLTRQSTQTSIDSSSAATPERRGDDFASRPMKSNNFSSSSLGSGGGHVDRYAVFQDIDNLPSIFESASLGSLNKLNSTASAANLIDSSFGTTATTTQPTAINFSNNNNHHQFNSNQFNSIHQLGTSVPRNMTGTQLGGFNHAMAIPSRQAAQAHLQFSQSFNTTTYLPQSAAAAATSSSSSSSSPAHHHHHNQHHPYHHQGFGGSATGFNQQAGNLINNNNNDTISMLNQNLNSSSASSAALRSNSNLVGSTDQASVFQRQQTNPFDDDFFA